MSATIENPMNAAHNHAANADEHTNNGLIVLAMEEHFKAAKAYVAAIERSHDDSAKRTLRMLHSEQLKTGKDLQRRIEKLKEDGKDPSLPQPISNPTTNESRTRSAVVPAQRSMNPQPVPNRVESPQPLQRMVDTVDESFMLLGGQRSEPGDPFNQFWNIMQGMLDNLSQPVALPVAFATAPLGSVDPGESLTQGAKTPPITGSLSRREASFGNDTEVDEPILSRLGRRIGMAKDSMRPTQRTIPAQATLDEDEEFDDTLFDDADELSESFLVVPSGTEHTPAALRKENTSLRAELANMQRRLETAEKVLQLRREQDLQLRDSIYRAAGEAHRVMGASMLQRPGVDLNNLNLNVPPLPIPGLTPSRENQYLQRIKELENEVRQARIDNEKNKAMITKYRERWEKLKESAKRKKEAKAAADLAASPVRERIVEEPEAEEALDNT